MAEVRWIKIVTDIFDDEKILLIESMPEADSIIVIWFKLLCLAGKQNNSGVFMLGRLAYTDEMFSTIFRRPINTIRLALKTFETFGMIEIINNTVTIPNWSKHQTLDKIEQKNQYMRDYMREYREKQKALTDGKSNSKTNSKSNVSEAEKKEKRLETELETDERKTAGRFSPPTPEDVAEYCRERGNGIDSEAFVDYYTANGWRVGKTPMKDWKAAVRTWEKRDEKRDEKPARGPKRVSAQDYEQRTYTEAELDAICGDPILNALRQIEKNN